MSLEATIAIVLCGLLSTVSCMLLPGNLPQLPLESDPVVLVNPTNTYVFGYQSDDGLGTTQHRHEISDGTGVVKGSYGYKDAFGVFRTVNYTADANGYRAVVRSNEPGFAPQNSRDVVYVADAPSPILAPPLVVRVKKPVK